MLDKRGVKPLVILVSLPPLTGFREARVNPALSRAGVVATFLPLDLRGGKRGWPNASFFLYADLSPPGIFTPYP